jgi:uridine kinase
MKGDVIVVEERHIAAARQIVPEILEAILAKDSRYTITVAGESGSGKSEMGRALADELEAAGINTELLGQDDYFFLPPGSNDTRRREDPDWLGPHVELDLDLLDAHLKAAIEGADSFIKPLIDYHANSVEDQVVDLAGVKVVIAEGTYTSLLKHVDTRIFIALNRLQTLEHRKKRNRGDEVGDPFIENILRTEHKIIAGHKQLADFVISEDYVVTVKAS